MTESSFPIVGLDLTNAAWGQTVGATSNGILDDWGSAYAIVVNTNDTVTVKRSSRSGVARAVVNGFGHQMDADVTLTVAAVTSTTKYHIGLLYDPGNVTLPVKLVVLKGTTVPLTAGQAFLPLHIFVRQAGQTLAAAALYSPRPRVQPRLVVASATDLKQMDPLLFLNGTEALATDVRRTYRASGSLASPEWVAGPMQGYWRGQRSTQMANANPSAVLGFAVSSADNDSWMSMADSGVFTLDEGIYEITATMTLPQKATGRSFVEVASPSGETYARGSFGAGEDRESVTFPTKVTAPTGYRVFGYQTTGKQIAPTFTLNVVRVA
ncbi:hypothetical protein [Curtobacterium flaccumfaciens]|uniref:hypothetical protein n=1 Tax=Curtobacterium flaccumfaciens TaxID=2035 RepID=UPI001BDF0870|nr:hypothetical protein [Curtobacterium flaccumfaciens]MBT1630462.1 hypothetical protein [Curtobacterium flaccumfaciens pv. oortii]MCX2843941.1 hypothetical protein [Curtobacterium flaccumfaciens pv. oortii]